MREEERERERPAKSDELIREKLNSNSSKFTKGLHNFLVTTHPGHESGRGKFVSKYPLLDLPIIRRGKFYK